MSKHPAAALLARDLGNLQHTNDRGETGLIHLPGFMTAGLAPEQAQAAGLLAQAIGEAIIETLDKRHGYAVVHRSELGNATVPAPTADGAPPADAPTPAAPVIPPRPQFISEQQRQTLTEQLGDQPAVYNREQSLVLVTMLAANLERLLNDSAKLPWVHADITTAEDGFTLAVQIRAPI